jgi:RimJ/RimL family protein N-acetyltransferase
MYTFNHEGETYDLIVFSRKIVEDNCTPISNYYTWFMDQEVTKYNSHGLFPQNQKEFDSFFDSIGENNIVLALIHRKSGLDPFHIGNVSLQRINWINRSAELAVVIGELDFWGKGITSKACLVLLHHGFEKLNLNRIWTGTASTNVGMQKVAEKIGMKKEGTSKQGMFLENTYVDVVHYGITKKDYDKLDVIL